MKEWNARESSVLYGIDFWGKPYFSINDEGHAQVHPKGIAGPKLDLFNTINELKDRHSRFPMLLRFPDIIESQMKLICNCFEKAIKDYEYKGDYRGVFPIKVNQQSHIIEDIVKAGDKYNFGLEAGSKPELLIALALMNNPDNLIVCNGFKDRSYIEMALISQKAGKNIIIVVERKHELDIILEISKELDLKPQIGFRLKLNTQNRGLWADSSGVHSKFGLTSIELFEAIKSLKAQSYLDCVKLVHFHIGSQIPSIQPIKMAIKETGRFVSELYKLGCSIQYVDVGGGLGVDYDGSGATRSSTNYDVQEYANDIVFGLQSACDENNVPHPTIISESGRFIVAQSSLLIFDIVDVHSIKKPRKINTNLKKSTFIQEMQDVYKNISKNSINESFNDLIEKRKDMNNLFLYGVLSLEELAIAESIYWEATALLEEITACKPDYDDLFKILKQQLTDTYFCNFSVFQSLPDSWALSYRFPIMPIHRLNQFPERRAWLVDLTCDSDGKIKNFFNYKTWEAETHLPVHSFDSKNLYLMGIFLTGAYQEILGDLHNLFGDTDAVHISIRGDESYSIDHRVSGDSILDVLHYVQFHRKELLEKIHKTTEFSIGKGSLSRQEAGLLLQKFEESLSSYTYLK